MVPSKTTATDDCTSPLLLVPLHPPPPQEQASPLPQALPQALLEQTPSSPPVVRIVVNEIVTEVVMEKKKKCAVADDTDDTTAALCSGDDDVVPPPSPPSQLPSSSSLLSSLSTSQPEQHVTNDTAVLPVPVVTTTTTTSIDPSFTTTTNTTTNTTNTTNITDTTDTPKKPPPTPPQRRRRHRRRRVIVIGSGMAGLCAARELQQRGYSIVIIEAQSRIGGRLKSYDLQVLRHHHHHHHHHDNPSSDADIRSTKRTTTTNATTNANATTTTTTTTQPTRGKRGNLQSQNHHYTAAAMTHHNTTTTTTTNKIHKNNNNSNIHKSPSNSSRRNTLTGNTTATKQKHSESTSTTTTTVPMDIGGALIHGIVDNPLYTMVHDDLHISTRPLLSDDCLLLSQNGWPVDVQHDKHISQVFNDCLSETFTRIADPTFTTTTTTTTTTASSSFGDLFDQVCRERNVNTNIPLFRWYQANLELSSGTTFQNLGYTWNDDEPYGYDGDHVAITSSWKSVCTTLGETLYVLYNSPVTNIHVVHPDPELVLRASQMEQQSQEQTQHNKIDVDVRAPIEHTRNKQKNTKSSPFLLPSKSISSPIVMAKEPQRQSRRIRGEDVTDVRRSNRSNKGIIGGPATNTNSNGLLHSTTASSKKRSRHDTTTNVNTKTSNPSISKEIRSKVQVTLQSGITLEADAVVCTIPLGVLKEGSVTFDPPLPLPKQLAIQQLGSGLFNKCALTFAKQFWQNSDFLGMVDAQHSYLILNASKYTNQPVLLFLYGGAFAKEIEEWTDHDVVSDCLSILRRICGRECVTTPIDYHVTRWGKDPYSRMSFTYVPSGVNGLSEFKAMSQPIYDHTGTVPVLMFAGEHTTPYHPSTIHGAYLSGIREAYRYDCALDPEANHFLEFTEDNVYERTFSIKRKLKDASTIQKDSSTVTASMEAVVDTPRTQLPTTGVSLRPTNHQKTVQSYARRRYQNGSNGMMTLRHRPKSYFTLNTSKSREVDDNRGAVPAVARSTEPNHVVDQSSNVHLSNTASPIPTRRSQRKNTDYSKSPVQPESVVLLNGITVAKAKSTRRSTVGTTSPSRRSQRTTPTKVSQYHGKNGHVFPDQITSSSIMKRDTIANDVEDHVATAAAIHRERQVLENRILLRSLESYGPDYDFIYKTVLPIYQNGTQPATTISNDEMPFERRHLEQRCARLLRKTERINAQREATVLHYYKSWIATEIAPPTSAAEAETSKKRTKSNATNGKATKTHVFAVPPARALATPTTTRSGRTSKRPATMLLS